MRDTFTSEEKKLKDPKRLYAPGRMYHIVERKPCRYVIGRLLCSENIYMIQCIPNAHMHMRLCTFIFYISNKDPTWIEGLDCFIMDFIIFTVYLFIYLCGHLFIYELSAVEEYYLQR